MSGTNKCVTHPTPRDPVSDHPLKRIAIRNQVNGMEMLNSQLLESIPGGDLDYMKRLMTMGANPNAMSCLNYVNACHIAAMHDNDALDLLIRSGADSSRVDKQGRTPLYFAAWAGNVKQLALLLSREFRHSVPKNNLEITPSQYNEDSTLSDCWCDDLDRGWNVTIQLPPFQQGWTALHAASARAQHHCVQFLLTAGVDANAQVWRWHSRITALDVAGCAYYMGHNIDVNNLIKTVDLLLKAGGKFLEHCVLDTALHIAVELESKAAVEQMLQGGAPVSILNSQGLTAMHVCVKKRNKELLQLLINHKCSFEAPYMATTDRIDRSGCTVLCAAVKAEWIQGVCIALSAETSTITKENAETPIHIAAQLGNIDILQKILEFTSRKYNIDCCNKEGETALFKAISHNHLDVLKYLLKHGSSIQVENSDKANVFHVATKYGRKEILEYLLKYNSEITKRLINRSDSVGPPLYYAIKNNHPDCAELLISEGAHVFAKCNEYCGKTQSMVTLMHIAAKRNRCEIAKMIIKKDSTTIHASRKSNSNDFGWTPMHAACQSGSKEMIILLLHHGADLSAISNENYIEQSPIELLMKNVTKPTEFMQRIFDSFITCKGQEYDCEVIVDHRVLFPESSMDHMGVIKALINTGIGYDQNRLLLHPLVQSFLYPKWRSLLPFFCSLLALHVCFVLSLNVFALSLFWYRDRKIEPVPSIFRSSVWIYIIYLTACLLTIQEVIVINIKSKKYLLCLETSVKWLSTTLAIILPQVVSWDSKPNPEWARLFSSATLLFTWVRMMFLLSRLPDYGYYFLMYGRVATKVFKILVIFCFFIFGFSISFMIQFHAQPPFEGPWSSLLMTMVMMTSEFGYNEIINEKNVEVASASLIMMRLIFVLFLILVSIILMNLLVGVAVNDVNSLEIIGNINRLEKQVQFIISFDDIACNNFIKKILPTKLYNRWFENIKWENSITLVSSQPRDRINGYRLPASLREAIFEKAQSLKKQSDDERGTMLYQKKLDEMYKVIVNKDGNELSKSEGPDNLLMMKLDEIHKVIVKKDDFDPSKSEHPDKALMMKLDEIHKVMVKKDDFDPSKSEGPDKALMMKLDEIHKVIVKKVDFDPSKSEGPDKALMMKLDEIHKVIVKKDDFDPSKSEGPDKALMMKLDEIHKVKVKKDDFDPSKSEGPDKALMMKLDEIHKFIVKNDSAEPTTTERLASLDTAIHKIFEEIFKLRSELELKK